MRSRLARTALAAGLGTALALVPGVVSAAGTLDQQQPTTGTSAAFVNSTHSVAQTFTAGLTGALDQIDLAVNGTQNTTPLLVEIRDVDGSGDPGATVLATASLTQADVPDEGFPAVTIPKTFVAVPFATPAPVVAGTQYAIVLYSSGGYAWATVPDAYAGGKNVDSLSSPPAANSWEDESCSAFNQSTCDTAFKTYVTPGGDPTQLVAVDDNYTVAQDSTENELTVQTNDSNPAASSLNPPSDPPHGTVTIKGGPNQAYLYTPDPGFHGADTFTYSTHYLADTTKQSNTATVTITVTPRGIVEPPVQPPGDGGDDHRHKRGKGSGHHKHGHHHGRHRGHRSHAHHGSMPRRINSGL